MAQVHLSRSQGWAPQTESRYRAYPNKRNPRELPRVDVIIDHAATTEQQPPPRPIQYADGSSSLAALSPLPGDRGGDNNSKHSRNRAARGRGRKARDKQFGSPMSATPLTSMSSPGPDWGDDAGSPMSPHGGSDAGPGDVDANAFMAQFAKLAEARKGVLEAEAMLQTDFSKMEADLTEKTILEAIEKLNSARTAEPKNMRARALLGKAKSSLKAHRESLQRAQKAALMRDRYGEEWQEAAMMDLADADDEELQKVFDLIDKDGSGALDREEVAQLAAFFETEPMSDEQIDKAMKEMDEDGSGEVEFEEFVAWWKAKANGGRSARPGSPFANMRELEDEEPVGQPQQGSAFTFDLEHFKQDPKFELKLRGLFDRYDDDSSGGIDPTELADIMKKFGRPLTDEELDALIAHMEPGEDGDIRFESFKNLVLGKSASTRSELVRELRQCIISGLSAEQYADWAQGQPIRMPDFTFRFAFDPYTYDFYKNKVAEAEAGRASFSMRKLNSKDGL